MQLPDNMTIGEAFGPAMEITDQAAADEYFKALVERNMRVCGQTRERAEAATKSSLGYYAGYYGHETRERVERLFMCSHPVFGSSATVGAPTPNEALAGARCAAGAASRRPL